MKLIFISLLIILKKNNKGIKTANNRELNCWGLMKMNYLIRKFIQS